jgi:two-component system sensor histidine kinase KdpD
MSTKTMDISSLGSLETRKPRPSQFEMLVAMPSAIKGRSHSWWQDGARWLAGPAIILAITELFRHVPPVNVTTVGFMFLLAILVASTRLDLRFVVVMCVAAAIAYDYFFLPPVGFFDIDDPQDWVALTAFLTTALIGTKLSTTSRKKAEEATFKHLEVERLYTLSQRLFGTGDHGDLLKTIPALVAESLGLEAAALYVDGKQEVFYSNPDGTVLNMEDLREAAYISHPLVNDKKSISIAAVRLGESVYGSLALFGPSCSRETTDAVAALVSIAIGRASALDQVAKVEAAREHERLKSVLLDAITHDFRTPLTSIKICATGLLEDLSFDREQRKDLLEVIDEECDRISRLVGEASEMARLECGEVKLEIASQPVSDLINGALEDCRTFVGGREIRVRMQQPGRHVSVDTHLAAKVLVHLVTNAHLYSPAGQPITVSAEERDGFEFISVADSGPGIDSAERASIFEKFYRGKNQRHRVQGTGMGLAISKAIVEAHGGTIAVTSKLGQGSVFTFSVPLEHEHAVI